MPFNDVVKLRILKLFVKVHVLLDDSIFEEILFICVCTLEFKVFKYDRVRIGIV